MRIYSWYIYSTTRYGQTNVWTYKSYLQLVHLQYNPVWTDKRLDL